MKRYTLILLLSLIAQSGWSQISTIQRLLSYPLKANSFTETYPHEKVYLHMDNRSYFLDETLWFKAYVVNSDSNKLTKASEILHIELLTPEGAVIRSQKQRLKDGQCDGYFTLDSALYSGYFEIRAYTKAMLNFGEHNYFSRVFPLFEKPKKLGDYDSIRRTRPRHRTVGYPEERNERNERKENKMPYYSIHFYPEGGNLVANLKSTIAFQIKDSYGKIVNTKCYLYDNKDVLIDSFSSTHLGMGTFQLIPKATKKGYYLKIQDDFKDSQYPLPTVFEKGHTISVDNLSDSLKLNVRIESTKLDDTLGVVVLSSGRVGSISVIAPRAEKPIHELSISKSNLREGVNQVVIYDKEGRELVSRMIFIRKHYSAVLTIKATPQTDISSLKSYEKQAILFNISDNKGLPIASNFSLSIYDSTSHIPTFCNDNIYTNLLLSSELKGFIPNVNYYFESKDAARGKNLDMLLMVNGWSRYKWESISGYQKTDFIYYWEKELAIYGGLYKYSRGSRSLKDGLAVQRRMMDNDKDIYLVFTGTQDGGNYGSEEFFVKIDRKNGGFDDLLHYKDAGADVIIHYECEQEMRLSLVQNGKDIPYHDILRDAPSFHWGSKRSGEYRRFYVPFDDFYGEYKIHFHHRGIFVKGDKNYSISDSESPPQEKPYDPFEINRSNDESSRYILINGEYIRNYSLREVNVYAQTIRSFQPSIKLYYHDNGLYTESFYDTKFSGFPVPILDRVTKRAYSSEIMYHKRSNFQKYFIGSVKRKDRSSTFDGKTSLPVDISYYENLRTILQLPFNINEYFDYYKLPFGSIAFIANTIVDTTYNNNEPKKRFTIPLGNENPEMMNDYGLDTLYTYFIDSTIIHTDYNFRNEIHTKFGEHRNYKQFKTTELSGNLIRTSSKQQPDYVIEHFCRVVKNRGRPSRDHSIMLHARRWDDGHMHTYFFKKKYDNRDRTEIFQGLTKQEREFYSPNYSNTPLPKQGDYRRTLYWNPNVQTDSSGSVLVEFYNNSTCKKYKIDAQTVTKEGKIGVILMSSEKQSGN